MWWLIVFMAILIGFGLLVDWWHKKHGITNFNPDENAKNISTSERIYAETYLNNIKNGNDNGGPF
ncbi:hypothetical protein [Neobacillus sp. D3-1R]|uniref:hypothetical protein n=1 Tax=Neobacillus sp. D3-1R TaxID=3445778 RepID=UPI003F9F9AE7